MKLRRLGWARHVAHMGRWEQHAEFLSRNLIERYNLGDLGVVAIIILKWVLGKRV
jgi:hypothetical protein